MREKKRILAQPSTTDQGGHAPGEYKREEGPSLTAATAEREGREGKNLSA